MKRLNYIYFKPQNYYNRLITFFVFISFSLTLVLVSFDIKDVQLFILKFIVVLFLLLAIAAMIEFLTSGDYIGPLEVYNLEMFFNNFLISIKEDKIKSLSYFNKYDHRSKARFKVLFSKGLNKFFLSSIKKHGEIYEITFIDRNKVFEYFFVKFFAKRGIHKMFIKHEGHDFKIISLI